MCWSHRDHRYLCFWPPILLVHSAHLAGNNLLGYHRIGRGKKLTIMVSELLFFVRKTSEISSSFESVKLQKSVGSVINPDEISTATLPFPISNDCFNFQCGSSYPLTGHGTGLTANPTTRAEAPCHTEQGWVCCWGEIERGELFAACTSANYIYIYINIIRWAFVELHGVMPVDGTPRRRLLSSAVFF